MRTPMFVVELDLKNLRELPSVCTSFDYQWKIFRKHLHENQFYNWALWGWDYSVSNTFYIIIGASVVYATNQIALLTFARLGIR
jgi:hypothetical protein